MFIFLLLVLMACAGMCGHCVTGSGCLRILLSGAFSLVGRSKPCSHGSRVDADWLEYKTLAFQRSSDLSLHQRTALEMDYGMKDGRLKLAARRAMRMYALRRLGFVTEPLEPPMLNELKQLEWVPG